MPNCSDDYHKTAKDRKADFLPQLPPGLSHAEQVRRLGLAVGDTIEGRDERFGNWWEARLTLLWIGQQIVAWRVQRRSAKAPDWRDEGESVAWTLDCRRWRRVSTETTTRKEK